MNEKNLQNQGNGEKERHMLSLPVEEEKLAEFISSLLGQPQRIQRRFDGFFDIDHEWLNNLHHLISQSLTQQHQASLVDFSAFIFFEDGIARKLTSVEAFMSFKEVRNIASVGIRLKWTYLIQFPNKSVPEKQEIEFGVSTPETRGINPELLADSILSESEESYAYFVIDTTERTWGDDLEAFLTRLCSEKVESENAIYTNIKAFGKIFAYFVFLLAFFVPNYVTDLINSKVARANYASIFKDSAEHASTLEGLSEKMDVIFFFRTMVDTDFVWGVAYHITAILLMWTVALSMLWAANIRAVSFLVITEKSKKERDKYYAKQKNKPILMILAFASSIAASITANYLFYYMHTAQ